MSQVKHSIWFNYAIAAAAVAIATGLRLLVAGWFGDTAPLFSYVVATTIVAWRIGTGPAVFTAFSGYICAYWFVIDPSPLAAPLGTAAIPQIVAYAAVTCSAVAITMALRRARDQAARSAGEAQIERERLKVTLASIGEAVIVTDERGRINFLNGVAQQFTVRSPDEALGKPIAEVFEIASERSLEPIENLVSRVLHQRRTIGLGSQAQLVTQKGGPRPIDGSLAPIRDAEGHVIGVVLVFRDVGAHRRAEQERAKLAAIVESSRDAIVSNTLDGTITSWNAAAQDTYGYSPDEIVGRSIAALIPPERSHELHEILSRLQKGEGVENYETVRIGKTGARIDVSVSVAPMRDEEGRTTGAAAIVRDVSERKRTEQMRDVRLAVSEAFTRAETIEQAADNVLSTIGNGLGYSAATLWMVDERASVLQCRHFWHASQVNASALEQVCLHTTRREGEGLPGRVWTSRQASWLLDLESDTVRALAGQEAGVSSVVAVPIELEGKVLGILEFFSATRRKPDLDVLETLRTVAGLLGQLIDRRRAESALLDETRITETLNTIGRRLAAELDQQKLVELVTDEATKLTGAQFGAFFYNVDNGEEAYQLSTVTPDLRKTFERLPMPRNTQLFVPTFRGERVVRYDDVTQAADFGRNAPFYGFPEGHLPVKSYLAAPVNSRFGTVIGGLFFGHSEVRVFTERDEQLIQGIAAQAGVAMDNARLYQELQQGDRRKDEFLAMLAHELRNPLAPVRNAVEILRLASGDEDAVANARGILERQVEHLVRLVDDLLDVSRIMRGKIQLRKQLMSMATIAERSLETARPLIETQGHHLTVNLPEQPVWVDADPVRLAQVLSNLLNNAAKYTPRGGSIELSLSQEKDKAVVRVRDTGIGISADLLPQVFDLFVQADQASNRSHDGLGIGLTVVRSLVEMHDGRVSVTSPGVGKGSEFTVRLPLAIAPIEATTHAHAPALLHSNGAGVHNILVVDDNVDSATTLGMLLRLSGHEVATAHNGESALVAALANPPDVAFLDLGMPEMDGYELARRFREQPTLSGTALVALTGWGQDEDRVRSKAAGFDQHLVKPVDLTELQGTLDRVRRSTVSHDS